MHFHRLRRANVPFRAPEMSQEAPGRPGKGGRLKELLTIEARKNRPRGKPGAKPKVRGGSKSSCSGGGGSGGGHSNVVGLCICV